ncbi:hypothetical protein FDB52_12080 [Clostridium botulinum]|nr:hypothetical protein [Clostridium botulinum]NFN49271.1 hypothetical protein [Clostridium botulinum]
MEFKGSLFGEWEDTRSEFVQVFDSPLDRYTLNDIDNGDDKLGLKFNSRTSITLYKAFDTRYSDEIIGDKTKLKFGISLYESLEYASIDLRKRKENAGMTVLAFDVDISNTLDLLDMKYLKVLKDFRNYALKKKILNTEELKEDTDVKIIEKYYTYNKGNKMSNFDIVRMFKSSGKAIYAKSEFKETTYIQYVILNTKCIKRITKVG